MNTETRCEYFNLKYIQRVVGAFLFLLIVTCQIRAETLKVDILDLQEALLQKRYDYLEKQLESLHGEYLSGKNDDWQLAQAMDIFESTTPEYTALLEEWVKRSPKSAIAHTALGLHLEHLGWTSRGDRWAKDTRPEQFSKMEKHFKMAVEQFNLAVSLDPTLSIGYAELISMLGTSNDYLATEGLLKKSLKSNPNSFMIRYMYLYRLQPKWGGSLKKMSRYILKLESEINAHPSLKPLAGFVDYTIADQLMLDNDYRKAADSYTKAIKCGEFTPYYEGRGYSLKKLGKKQGALSDYNSALAITPYSVRLLKERADLFVDMGQYENARNDLELALRLDPLKPSLLRYSAWLYNKRKQPDKAITDYNQSLIFDSYNANTYTRMADIENNRKNYRAASRHYHKAVEIEPNNSEYWFEYSTAMFNRKECEIRYPLSHYIKSCEGSNSLECDSERIDWATKTHKGISAMKSCSVISDDTIPDF